MAEPAASYPVTLTVDYPDRDLNRLTTFFRSILIVPAALMLALVTIPIWGWGARHEGFEQVWRAFFATGTFLFVPTLLMILFRRKYPRWWFDWNVNVTKFSARVGAYAALVTDEYPSTERDRPCTSGSPTPMRRRTSCPACRW